MATRGFAGIATGGLLGVGTLGFVRAATGGLAGARAEEAGDVERLDVEDEGDAAVAIVVVAVVIVVVVRELFGG